MTWDVAAYNAMLDKFLAERGLPANGTPGPFRGGGGGGGGAPTQAAPSGGFGGPAMNMAVAAGIKKALTSGATSAGESILSATAPEAAADAFVSNAIGDAGTFVPSGLETAGSAGAEAASSAASGAAGTIGAEAGRNVLGMGNPGMLGGLGMVVGAVQLGKLLGHTVIDPAARKLMGAKAARPMSGDEISASTGNLKAQLGTSDPGALKYALDNNLLLNSYTKRDPGEDMSALDRHYGPQFNIFSISDMLRMAKDKSINKGGKGSMLGGMSVPWNGSIQSQLGLYNSDRGYPWSKTTQAKAAAALGIPGLAAVLEQTPTAPARSNTSSPGIGKDGRRISTSRK